MTESTFIIEKFNILETINENLVKIRLFPFGKLVKNGVERIITPELAATFRLPHFKPPLKLGSHEEATPGGGTIVSLEVGDDGLYGLIETTVKGAKAIAEKLFNYHSPEVIWSDGWIENPETGDRITGPLIVGDALLHTPHLGEAAALYTIEPIDTHGGVHMSETVTVPTSLWDRMTARLFDNPEPKPEPAQEPQALKQEDFAVELKAEKVKTDELTATIATMEAEKTSAARVAHFAAELENEGDEIHQLLAGLDEEVANKIVSRFKAIEAQGAADVDSNVGGAGDMDGNGDPRQQQHAAIEAYQAEHKVTYAVAVTALAKTKPDLFEVKR